MTRAGRRAFAHRAGVALACALAVVALDFVFRDLSGAELEAAFLRQPAGTNRMMVEPCWKPPISSPLPKRASTGISLGPRYFRCSSTSVKRRRMLATRMAATGTMAIGMLPRRRRALSTARSLRQNSFSTRLSAIGLTFQVSPVM